MRPRLHLFVLPLAAAIVVAPLLRDGASCGHDLDFHLLSWLEAARQFAHGNLHPHWASTPAFNAGEPRFVFYPPLSWTLGALLTLLLSHLPHLSRGRAFALTPILFTWIALTSAGLSMHALARRYTAPAAALLGATFYLCNPYTLFTAYERTAFGELLAAAFLPLLLLTILPPPDPAPPTHLPTPGLALAVALLWLTNAPAAVMACYALALLTATRLVLPTPGAPPLDPERWVEPPLNFRALWTAPSGMSGSPRTTLALTTIAGTLLGLLLPAFYLLPAAYERRYVQITLATIQGMRPTDHFLFHRMAGTTDDDLFHNAVVHTASTVSLLLLAAILLAAAATKILTRPKQNETSATKSFSRPEQSQAERPASPSPLTILLPLTLLLAFLLTPPSLFLWNHTPQLAFLQFPWRLDALLAVVLLVLLSGWPIIPRAKQGLSWGYALAPILLAALLILPAYRNFHQSCDATDTPTARAALFHSPVGTEPTDEYTPVTADNDALHHSAPWWLTCLSTHPDPNAPSSMMPMPGPTPRHIEWEVPCRALIVLNRRLYPDWRVTVNGQSITPLDPTRDDGLIAFIEPRGHMSLRIRWVRAPDQTLGLVLSALAVLIAAALFWKARALDKAPPDPPPLNSRPG